MLFLTVLQNMISTGWQQPVPGSQMLQWRLSWLVCTQRGILHIHNGGRRAYMNTCLNRMTGGESTTSIMQEQLPIAKALCCHIWGVFLRNTRRVQRPFFAAYSIWRRQDWLLTEWRTWISIFDNVLEGVKMVRNGKNPTGQVAKRLAKYEIAKSDCC